MWILCDSMWPLSVGSNSHGYGWSFLSPYLIPPQHIWKHTVEKSQTKVTNVNSMWFYVASKCQKKLGVVGFPADPYLIQLQHHLRKQIPYFGCFNWYMYEGISNVSWGPWNYLSSYHFWSQRTIQGNHERLYLQLKMVPGSKGKGRMTTRE